MSQLRGEFLLMYIEDSGNPGTYLKVGACRVNGFSLGGDQVDISDKDSTFRKLLTGGGLRTRTITFSGPFNRGDDACEQLLTAAETKTNTNFRLAIGDPGGSPTPDVYQGLFQVSSMDLGGSADSDVEMTGTLESAGTITKTPGS